MFKILFLFFTLFSTTCVANNAVMEIIPLQNRPASELQALISPLLERSERIIANGTNLILKATPARQKELSNLINRLDSRLNNLLITVIQSRTKTAQQLNNSARINVEIPLNKLSNLSGSFRGHFGRTEGLKNSESTQQIRTLEGKAALIKTGKTHPITNINIYGSGYGHPNISTNTQFIEATTGLMVIPRLTGNRVIMQITPWSNKMNNHGTIDTQGAHTSIQVNLGEWVEIGGISEQSQSSANRNFSHNTLQKRAL